MSRPKNGCGGSVSFSDPPHAASEVLVLILLAVLLILLLLLILLVLLVFLVLLILLILLILLLVTVLHKQSSFFIVFAGQPAWHKCVPAWIKYAGSAEKADKSV